MCVCVCVGMSEYVRVCVYTCVWACTAQRHAHMHARTSRILSYLSCPAQPGSYSSRRHSPSERVHWFSTSQYHQQKQYEENGYSDNTVPYFEVNSYI